MAQNVTINDVDYTGVPGVEIPLTSGVGTALYLDAENYRTAAEQDVIDESKQPTITDLATIRSGASAGATALQSSAIVSSVSSASTNGQVPGAKLFYDTVGDIETLLGAML